ncbi:MAG: hypothetical protein JWO38_6881 [Gemmataceae bacterium]|nr:hypothetical protein [Gemmataceae bacterium]
MDKHNFGPDASNRLEEFGIAVSQANSLLEMVAELGGVRVLVAPEYYFSGRSTGLGKNLDKEGPNPMSRDAKHDLYAGLKKISSMAGSLVIVAGSIFYTKNGFWGKVQGFSVCPVLRNGQFLTKLYKVGDDQNLKYNMREATYTSKDAAPYFTVDGVRFGVDICADHSDGRLKKWAEDQGQTIDVHIVVAEGSAVIRPRVAARPNGYAILCDMSGDGDVDVLTCTGAWTTVVPTSLPRCGRSNPQINGVVTYVYKFDVLT